MAVQPSTKNGHVEKLRNQKMDSQGQRSDSADGNKILIITILAYNINNILWPLL